MLTLKRKKKEKIPEKKKDVPKPKKNVNTRTVVGQKLSDIKPDYYDNNMIFGVQDGRYVGLSLNNQKTNRSANVLVIGGTGTGKTFKYLKPNLLQENCSQIVTDPSGDIYRSFAPYLLSKGYNVMFFNANDFSESNHYNPLENVYDANGEISENLVNILVDIYMKNAKKSQEGGKASGDPFWDSSEKAFMMSLIYYTLEEDEEYLRKGFDIEVEKPQTPPRGVGSRTQTTTNTGQPEKEIKHMQPLDGGRCFNTILKLVQEGKVSDNAKEKSPLTLRLDNFFERKPTNKCKQYYDTFRIAPEKTANTILICTAVDLQIFATRDVDRITRTNEEYPDMNIDIDKMATQQSYLFLGIPQAHQAFNFLIAMLYSQLYNRLYELGERVLVGKWHIGYRVGTPVFDYFDSEEQAKEFFCTVSENNILEEDYVNNNKIYKITWNGKVYKTSVLREPLVEMINNIDKMYIWQGTQVMGTPALPIHVNFLLDEFKNIGEIPNFLGFLATSRKYRIGSHVIIQDVGQIKTMYKENEHETLLANVDTTIFLGSILIEDKEYIQKILGKTTIRQRSTSSAKTGLTTSYTPTEVSLMSIDEIGAINDPTQNRDDCLIIVRDTNPILCRKLNLTEHCRYKECKKAEKEMGGVRLRSFYCNTGDTKAPIKAEINPVAEQKLEKQEGEN